MPSSKKVLNFEKHYIDKFLLNTDRKESTKEEKTMGGCAEKTLPRGDSFTINGFVTKEEYCDPYEANSSRENSEDEALFQRDLRPILETIRKKRLSDLENSLEKGNGNGENS